MGLAHIINLKKYPMPLINGPSLQYKSVTKPIQAKSFVMPSLDYDNDDDDDGPPPLIHSEEEEEEENIPELTEDEMIESNKSQYDMFKMSDKMMSDEINEILDKEDNHVLYQKYSAKVYNDMKSSGNMISSGYAIKGCAYPIGNVGKTGPVGPTGHPGEIGSIGKVGINTIGTTMAWAESSKQDAYLMGNPNITFPKPSINTEIIKREELPSLKRNNKFISILTTDLVKKDRIFLTERTNKHNMIIISPGYKYNHDFSDLFLLHTSFIDVDSKTVLRRKESKDNESPQIMHIHSSAFDMETLQLFKYYDTTINNYMKNNFKDIKCKSALVVDNNKLPVDLYPGIDIHIPSKTFIDNNLKSYAGKLFNYNISKKYKLVEEHDIINGNINDMCKKILYCKKQIRFLISPVSWIHPDKKSYGSYLKVFTIEVKYPNARIKSIFDMNQELIEMELINISI